MQFKQWVEALQFKDVQARSQLSQHPYVQEAGIGVEIEMTAQLSPEQQRRIRLDPDEIEPNDIVEVWLPVIKRVVENAGFRVGGENAEGDLWGVGPDAYDSETYQPILEIRTGILRQRDLPKFSNFLLGLIQTVKQNKPYLDFPNNTGIHVHVSNPGLGSENSRDAFTRLAALSDIDEPHIWNDLAKFDRPFERFARLNKQSSYSNDMDYHDSVIEMFKTRLNFIDGQDGTKEVAANFIDKALSGLDRHAGINATAGKQVNTVEYRHLTSAILLEPNGIEKLMDYINYFVQHLARKSHSQQIVIKGESGRMVFTRMPFNRVRVDYQAARNYYPTSTQPYPKVPQSGMSHADLKSPRVGRGSQPFSTWWKGLSPFQQKDYKIDNRLSQLSKASPGGA